MGGSSVRRYAGTGPVRRRLLCFPHAGGSASSYADWQALLPPDTEVLAIQYPGRENRLAEPAARSLIDLAEDLADDLLPELKEPSVCFGHSMGALVAYEVVRCWQRRGGPLPTALVVSSQLAPRDLPATSVVERDDEGVLQEVEALAGPLPDLVRTDDALRRVVVDLLRADYEAISTYVPADDGPVAVGLTAVCGSADPLVSPVQAARWHAYTDGRFSLHVLPGGHFYLRDDPEDVLMLLASAAAVPDRSPNLEGSHRG